MTKTISLTGSYTKLVADLARLMEQGRQRAMEAVAEVRNQVYWEMGRRLGREAEIQEPETRSELVNNLAADLQTSRANLYRALRFYHTYPEGLPEKPPARLLSWSAHQMLLPISDRHERDFYLKRAVDEGWSVRALRRAIANNLYEAEASAGRSGRRHVLERPTSRVHNYAAEVQRVIDGDTLEVRIDLGFDTWRAEKIRLRGVDAPELRTPAGKRARKFVGKELAGVKRVVVRTYKTDVYARYVGDVFYSRSSDDKDEIFARGSFLNQELLDAGMARPGFY